MVAGVESHAVDNGSSAGEAPKGSEERPALPEQPALPELPYHRFSNGDGILLVNTLSNGELLKADSQASSAAQPHFL